MVEKITQPQTPLENTEKINEIIDDLGNKVDLSSQQNISGVKTFTGGTIPIRTYADYMDSTQAPTEYKEQGILTFDVNNKRIGAWATSISTNGEIQSYISASREINGQMVYSVLSTHIDQSGNMYATAPGTPSINDISGKIVTTKWINDAKSMISCWGMPSSKADILTLGASGAQYTAPANGCFAFFANYQSGADANVSLQNMSTPEAIVGMEHFWYSPKGSARLWCPAKKGDEISVFFNCTMKNIYFKFIYAEGDK